VANEKIVFVAFAIEDKDQRTLLKGQTFHPRAPFEFVDMSVKEPYDKDWKDRVLTRIPLPRRDRSGQQKFPHIVRSEVGDRMCQGREEAHPRHLGLH
jgi:hypothetical protein